VKLLFYSSPYDYYARNLQPLIDHAKASGHRVYHRLALKPEKNIKRIKIGNIPIATLIKKVDAVILVQPWWYLDREIADVCRARRVPLYIVDHAPPMVAYQEKKGRLSHLYRADLINAQAFFAYGLETKKIMKLRGCKGNIIVTGSPRIEEMLKNYKDKAKKKAFVLFDTSHRMEDKKTVRRMQDMVNRFEDWTFYKREHSRSTGVFPGKKLKGMTEEEVIGFADMVGFTFPSSAMLLPALVGKRMMVLYNFHFSDDAREFYRRYKNDIPGELPGKAGDYSKFLSDHYSDVKSPTKEILKYIERKL